MDPNVKFGSDIWDKMREPFYEALEAAIKDPAKRQLVWEGFIGSVIGSMASDVGVERAMEVPDKIKMAIRVVSGLEKLVTARLRK
jgi:hypothetical protein